MKRNAVFLMLFVIVLQTILPTAIMAGGCHVAVRHNVVVREVAVVEKVVVPLVARFVDIPLYSAQYVAPYVPQGYVAPHAAPATSNCAELTGKLTQLTEQVQFLKTQLERAGSGLPPKMPPADGGGQRDPFNPPVSNHQPVQQQQYSAEQTGDIIERVTNFNMPPKDPQGVVMTAAERLELVASLSSGKSDTVSRIMTKQCASCHNESNAKSMGKGVVLVRSR